jgi:hypothetical protein
MLFLVRASEGGVFAPGPLNYFTTLAEALDQACNFLAEGMTIVQIETPDGKFIGSDDLGACCRGEKTLTDDLTAN